jgi:F0F1-type ATP synthase assembly protein I
MSRPHIGSDPSCGDARFWRFERNSNLPRGTFDEPSNKGDLVVLIFAIGVVAGIVTGLIIGWLQ